MGKSWQAVFFNWGCKMAKRKLTWTEDKIARHQKEGRGQGEGLHYKPWLTIQDVPSIGRAHRIKGFKTGRIHHLLSDLERDYFYLLEWADEVLDVREQFPLHRELTTQIAEEKRIRHSVDQETQTPLVMTTDFLVTVRRGSEVFYLARTLKPSDQLNTPRTIEKFEIEREYWSRKNVDWGIVTELDIPKVICRNIAYLHAHFTTDPEVEQHADDMLVFLASIDGGTLSEALEKYELHNFLDKGAALSCFKQLVASKRIRVDMHTAISKQMKMSELTIDVSQERYTRWAT